MWGSDWRHEDSKERFLERASWLLQFAWWPKRCIRSGRRIWLHRAYCGTWTLTGPGDRVFIRYWMTRNEYLIYLLTQ
jgi:hypothetical protein